jgi:hypothetical protein
VLGGFIALTFFRAFFATGLRFALALPLRGVAPATVRFAVLFRADFEGLRDLRRAVGFRFRTGGRFFR